jgi:hypothetical protein
MLMVFLNVKIPNGIVGIAAKPNSEVNGELKEMNASKCVKIRRVEEPGFGYLKEIKFNLHLLSDLRNYIEILFEYIIH